MNRVLLIPLLFALSSICRAQADTVLLPTCQLHNVFEMSFASEGDVARQGIAWKGSFVEAWISSQWPPYSSKNEYALVLSRTTHGATHTPHWKPKLHLTIYTRRWESKGRWSNRENYTIESSARENAELGYMQRSMILADADSNGVPEVYLSITAPTADGGGWDEATAFTNILSAGRRYEVIVGIDHTPFYTVYNATSRELERVRKEITPTIAFALCHMERAYAVRELRSRAFHHW